MPLHITHRPTKLKQLVGNKETIAALQSVLARKDELITHSWLFSGPQGCGKTTIARIVAKELGIHEQDFIEQNSASYRGIDSARDLIQQSRLRPLSGTRRGWLLDECHKLTADAQEALLKLVEEPPAHVFFFLATTDPQKLKKTLRERCQEFKVESLSQRDLLLLVAETCGKEKVDVPQEVRSQIAADAQGSARAALVVLDKIIDMEPAAMLDAARRASVEQNQSIDLCRALIKGEKWLAVAKILSGLGEYEVENLRLAVLGYCQAVLLKEDNARAWTVMDAFRDPFDRMGRPGVVWACYMCAGQQK